MADKTELQKTGVEVSKANEVLGILLDDIQQKKNPTGGRVPEDYELKAAHTIIERAANAQQAAGRIEKALEELGVDPAAFVKQFSARYKLESALNVRDSSQVTYAVGKLAKTPGQQPVSPNDMLAAMGAVAATDVMQNRLAGKQLKNLVSNLG